MSTSLPLAHIAVMWVTTRAAGLVALAAASASVTLGLAMAARVVRPAPGRADALKTVHEALAVATFAGLALHAISLLLDPWLKPGVGGVLIPFTMSYRPLATGAGIIAAYALVVLGGSAWLRGRLGPKRWKSIHRWTSLAWAVSVVHAITAGTDAGAPWMIAVVVACTAPPLALLAVRAARSTGFPGRYSPTPRRSSSVG